MFPSKLREPLKRDSYVLTPSSEGKGYVSMDNIESAGPVADFVRDVSTDGSGRYCVAAFHQIHCLVSPFHQVLQIITIP